MTTATASATTTVTVSTRDLKNALGVTSRAVNKRTLIPLLEGVCLTLDQTCLRVRGTNLDLGISCSGVPLEETDSEGEDIPFIDQFVVSAEMLSKVLSPINDDQIHLTFNPSEGTLLVSTKKSKSTVHCITNTAGDAGAFPAVEFPTKDVTRIGTISSADLKVAIARVAPAASEDESRQILTGVLLEIKEGKASLVGADGYRLARHTLPLTIEVEEDMLLVIPARSLAEVARIINGDVKISQIKEGNQVAFTFGATLVLSRLLDGKFPDYARIIPTSHLSRAAVGPQDFLRAIKSVTPFAKEASNHVTITFRDNELCLNANAAEVGSSEAVVPAQVNGATEEERRIALNGSFVKDALDGLKNEAEVWVEMQEPSKPLVITIPPVDKTGSEYTHVIMPMTLR